MPFWWIVFAIFVNFYHILNRLTQQRVEEGDRIKKLSPKERLKLLKETLKKSTTLTEKLLRRLDKKWDNIYKEDSEDGKSFFILFFSSDGLILRHTFDLIIFVLIQKSLKNLVSFRHRQIQKSNLVFTHSLRKFVLRNSENLSSKFFKQNCLKMELIFSHTCNINFH